MSAMNPKVAFYFDKAESWAAEYRKLRSILLACPVTEELKWGCPCYAVDGQNVVLIHGFKDYCALLFFKGALMKDPAGVLIQQTRNVQSARQIRFTGLGEIAAQEALIKAYVAEAIELEKSGAKVAFKPTTEFEMPEEFHARLEALPELKEAFEALTPGRQRGYLLHFSSAKQSKTREARIDKAIPQIIDGLGLDDKG